MIISYHQRKKNGGSILFFHLTYFSFQMQLTGIALTGDPEFDIFRASAPYATRRAVSMMGRQVTSRRRKTSSAIGF